MKDNIIKIVRYRDIVKNVCGCEHDMMVENFYQNIVKKLFQKRERKRNSINTIAQWERERKKIKINLEKAIGSKFPDTGVKIIEKGEIKKQDIIVRKILFSLHKDHYVPCLIYIPDEKKSLFPAVLIPAGHDINGKAGYNRIATFYAKNGYVAITYDFVGQGERQFVDKNGFVYAFASTAHNITGVPMTLYDFNLNWFTIFETISAIDVLKSTDFVDMAKIGITGASGGGTNSFYSAAFDERISAVAPAASVHCFLNKVYPDDCEQSFFNHIERGLDYCDIASFLIAPRHLFIVANSHDIWDIEGTKYVYETAKKFYRMHHAEEKLKITISDKGHGYYVEQIEQVLLWFNKIFDSRHEFIPYEKITENQLPSEKEICVLADNESRQYYLKNPLKIFKKNVNVQKDSGYIENIKRQLQPFLEKNCYWEIIDRYPMGNRYYCRMIFSPEKNLILPAEIVIPEKLDCTLILLDEIKRTEKQQLHIQKSFANNLVIRPDLRWCGETSYRERWEDYENFCQNNFSGKNFKTFIMCHILGRYVVVERAKDIICLVSILKKNWNIKKIIVHAHSSTAISAILAGIVDKRIEKLILEDFLFSYKSIFDVEYPLWRPDNFLQGILKSGLDIQDLCNLVHTEDITFIRPLDARMKIVNVNFH